MASTRGVLLIAAGVGVVALVACAVLLFRRDDAAAGTTAVARDPDVDSTRSPAREEVLQSPGREREPVRPVDAPKKPEPEVVLGEDELIARNRAKWDAETARKSLEELKQMNAALEAEYRDRARPKLRAMIDGGDSQVVPDGGLPAYEPDRIDETEITMVETDLETGRRRAVLPRKGNMDLYLLKAKAAWIAQVIDERAVLDTDPK